MHCFRRYLAASILAALFLTRTPAPAQDGLLPDPLRREGPYGSTTTSPDDLPSFRMMTPSTPSTDLGPSRRQLEEPRRQPADDFQRGRSELQRQKDNRFRSLYD